MHRTVGLEGLALETSTDSVVPLLSRWGLSFEADLEAVVDEFGELGKLSELGESGEPEVLEEVRRGNSPNNPRADVAS